MTGRCGNDGGSVPSLTPSPLAGEGGGEGGLTTNHCSLTTFSLQGAGRHFCRVGAASVGAPSKAYQHPGSMRS